MYKKFILLTLTALTMSVLPVSAEQFASGTIVLKGGHSVMSPKLLLDRAGGNFPVVILPDNIKSTVEYKDVARIIVASNNGYGGIDGVLELRDSRLFEVRINLGHIFKSSNDRINALVMDPISQAEATIVVHLGNVIEVDFTKGSTGQYRVAGDGRIYPPAFAFDPRTGVEMRLINDPLAASGN